MATTETFIDMDDTDPVKASYDIYIKPHLTDGKKLYILQFPNRALEQGYTSANSSLPLELRLKPKSGLLELDVPVDAWRNYDREKGAKWGDAMRRSNLGKGTGAGGGSHGLPGGFGIGGAQPGRARALGREVEEGNIQEAIMRDFAVAVTQQRVLTKQTLGGQAVPKEDQLHLTPVDQIVQMRPQFHHIDAQAELERLGRPREPVTARVQEPRAIHMTVKATADGEEETTDTMAERIRSAQEEPWQRLQYVDEDSTAAWEAFNQHLFVEDVDMAPKLVSSMENEEYLDAISAPRDAARLSRSKKMRNPRSKEKGKERQTEAEGAKSDSSSTLSKCSSGEEDSSTEP